METRAFVTLVGVVLIILGLVLAGPGTIKERLGIFVRSPMNAIRAISSILILVPVYFVLDAAGAIRA